MASDLTRRPHHDKGGVLGAGQGPGVTDHRLTTADHRLTRDLFATHRSKRSAADHRLFSFRLSIVRKFRVGLRGCLSRGIVGGVHVSDEVSDTPHSSPPPPELTTGHLPTTALPGTPAPSPVRYYPARKPSLSHAWRRAGQGASTTR